MNQSQLNKRLTKRLGFKTHHEIFIQLVNV